MRVALREFIEWKELWYPRLADTDSAGGTPGRLEAKRRAKRIRLRRVNAYVVEDLDQRPGAGMTDSVSAIVSSNRPYTCLVVVP